MNLFRVNGDPQRWLSLAAASLLLVFLANCGGGGGGDGVTPPPPTTGVSISGTVSDPSGAAVSNATVRSFPALQPGATPIAQTTTDANGRYTLSVPRDYIGRDLVIVAERLVNNQRVRLMVLVLLLPAQGYAGANPDAYTTLATEEILRYARQQNLTTLSPNGVATVVSRLREVLGDLSSEDLVVGRTLPDNIGDGLLDEQRRNQVRPRVEEQGQNLRPPTGDVATAKGMTQMLRDYGSGWLDRSDEESLRFEADVRRQEQLIENEIAIPLEELGERGVNFLVRMLGLEEGDDSLNGLRPGRYRAQRTPSGRYILQRIGNSPDNRTWIVEYEQLTCTVTTANPLDEFTLSPEAGRVNFSVRKQGDPRVQYDGVFEVTQRDANGNATQLRLQFTLSDGQLSEPIRFNGTMNTTPRPDGSFRTVNFSGTLQSQYSDLTVTNLVYDTYPQSERVRQISVGRVQGTLKTERGPVIDLQNLSITFADGDPPDKNIQQFTLQQMTFTAERRRLLMRNVNAQFQRVGGEPQPVRLQAEYVEYNMPNDTLTGQVNAAWQNPTATNPLEEDFIPLSQFPQGNFQFNGVLTPRVGRRALIHFNIVPEPTLNPARVRIRLMLDLGEERMLGDFFGNLRVVNGVVETQRLFRSATLQMTHTPSNFRLELSYDWTTETLTGTIKKPDGTTIAQIGRASALGLPDLGNTLIVRYTDGTFETVDSLLNLGN